MSKEQFCYWLQGVLEASGGNISPGTADMINDKLRETLSSSYISSTPIGNLRNGGFNSWDVLGGPGSHTVRL